MPILEWIMAEAPTVRIKAPKEKKRRDNKKRRSEERGRRQTSGRRR
jgi:hypothetical protein